MHTERQDGGDRDRKKSHRNKKSPRDTMRATETDKQKPS